MAFRYPDTAHQRRHGPRGYLDYQAYKPWLRDEFDFRCVYCLRRERWFPDGDETFCVEHLQPRSIVPLRQTDYDNLLYACLQCNARKQASTLVLDPCVEPYGQHLEVLSDGSIRGLTLLGIELIVVCQLDRPALTEYRRGMLEMLAFFGSSNSPEGVSFLRRYLGFPTDLPQLSALNPPGGNARPEGIALSYYELRQRGELPETY